jgi:hypothetical protein
MLSRTMRSTSSGWIRVRQSSVRVSSRLAPTKSTEGHPDAQHRRNSAKRAKNAGRAREASFDVTNLLRDGYAASLEPHHHTNS